MISQPDPFDTIVDEWMQKATKLWSLHDAICLLQKLNPAERCIPISPDIEDGKTTRPFVFILDAFNDPNNWFKPQVRVKGGDPEHASSYKVSKRAFLRWAREDWPHNAGHLERGKKRYDKLKKRTKQQIAADEKTHAHFNLFMEYFTSFDDPQVFHRMSDHKIATALWLEARKVFPDPYAERTLRQRIKGWRAQLKLPGPKVLTGTR